MKAEFIFRVSDDHRKKVLIETGEALPSERRAIADVRDLRPDHRQRYLVDRLDSEQPAILLRVPSPYGPGYASNWYFDGPTDDVNVLLDLHAKAYDAAKAVEDAKERERSAAQAKEEAERLERIRAREERERLAEEKQIAGQEALRSWSLDHGSELLRERVKGGYEYEHLAGKEFARAMLDRLTLPTAEVPLSFSDDYADVTVKDRTTPELAEIRTLKTVLASIESADLANVVKAELCWVIYKGKEDDYGDKEDDLKRPEIGVTVTDPTGAEHMFYFLAS